MKDEIVDRSQLESYLSQLHQVPVHIEQLSQLGSGVSGAAALKGFGYGRPVLIDYLVDNEPRQVVLRRVMRNGFGREGDADRVAEVWRDFHTFNRLPRHVQALDIVAVQANGRLHSLRQARELLLLTSYAPGTPYADDLLRIRQTGESTPLDEARAEALAVYLANIHASKQIDPLLWRRRLRDLIGHGEGILGLADSYVVPYPDEQRPLSPTLGGVTRHDLQEIEQAANCWRWWLKPLTYRLSQVHGDFHPFNVLFSQGTEFTTIDRSRGEWGAPEDDVACMSINYLFFSLQRSGSLTDPFARLYTLFWETYLSRSQDAELLGVIAPWFAWRALVLASPQWYPSLTDEVRQKLFHFARNVLAERPFRYADINRYLEPWPEIARRGQG